LHNNKQVRGLQKEKAGTQVGWQSLESDGIFQERDPEVAVCSRNSMALMPGNRLGNRYIAALLPMRIHASWFGSHRIGRIQGCGTMIIQVTGPIEAGSPSGVLCYVF